MIREIEEASAEWRARGISPSEDLPAEPIRSVDVPKRLAVLCLLTSLAASTPEAPARRAGVHGPWPLVSLAGLGTVTWRCDPSRHLGRGPGLPGLALGFRASRADQSGLARLRSAGRLVSERAFQPGDVIDFPYLPSRVQQVEIAESGEDGTLRAFVRVDFAPRAVSGYCWPYMPPATSVRLLARR